MVQILDKVICDNDKMFWSQKNQEVRQKVSKITLQLQSQTQVPLWALCNEMVIYAAATKQPVLFGKKGKILFLCIKYADKIRMADLILFFTGLLVSLSFYFKCKKQDKKKNKHDSRKKILVGFGACAEESLYEKFK